MNAPPTTPPVRLPERPARGRANLARLRRITDHAITVAAPPALPPLADATWQHATPVPPVLEAPIALPLEAHLLAWFRAHGPRTESRMHATLRAFVKRRANGAG